MIDLPSKKELIHKILVSHPIVSALLRKITHNYNKNTLTILNYHQVAEINEFLPDWCCLSRVQFQSQMEYLAKHYEVVHLSEGVKNISQGLVNNKPYAAITFDDGYQNNYHVAFPILKKMGLPATIFLATGFVNSDRTLWSSELNKALFETSELKLRWDGEDYDLSTVQAKSYAFRQLQNHLKSFSHSAMTQRCNNLIWHISGEVKRPIEATSPYRMLDNSAITEMLNSGQIDFGAHTRDHVILSGVSEEVQQKQIFDSIADVKKLTGKDTVLFAYPNGKKSDYNQISIKQLKNAGVQIAVTTIPGLNKKPLSALELKRIGVGGDWQLGIFIFALHTGLTSHF